MSGQIVREVLDHYHGNAANKIWLLALAIHANHQTRAAWSRREDLARQVGVSQSRSSHIAAELIAEGVIKRDGGGYRGRAAEYVFTPTAAWPARRSRWNGGTTRSEHVEPPPIEGDDGDEIPF